MFAASQVQSQRYTIWFNDFTRCFSIWIKIVDPRLKYINSNQKKGPFGLVEINLVRNDAECWRLGYRCGSGRLSCSVICAGIGCWGISVSRHQVECWSSQSRYPRAPRLPNSFHHSQLYRKFKVPIFRLVISSHFLNALFIIVSGFLDSEPSDFSGTFAENFSLWVYHS